MKFSYKRYGPNILRPVIPIELQYKKQAVQYEVLVDSGADFCIFDAEIGELLGLKIKKGREGTVSGVSGKVERYYLHRLNIVLGGQNFPLVAGFMPSMGKFGYGVVGQKGFFNLFVVAFDLGKEEIELQLREKQG